MNDPIEIQILEKKETEQFEVFWNDTLSHSFTLKQVQSLLEQTEEALWKTEENVGRSMGIQLFDLINGSAGRRGFGRRGLGKLDVALKKAHQKRCRLLLYLRLPESLEPLPFELLCSTSTQQFLLLERDIQVLRLVSDRNRRGHQHREDSPSDDKLQILFMACSPTDLSADQVLSFEQADGSPEEESILQQTENLQLHLNIEDSGNPKELAKTLIQEQGYDLIHITGHASEMEETDQTGEMKPVPIFYMETETGGLFKTTPEILWGALKDFPPRLLFLSGCSTGKSKPKEQMKSFAHQMVLQGIPWVLGWGLPVGDQGATQFAAQIYQALSMGKDLAEAVQRARIDLADQKRRYHPWPLLRIYTDGSPLVPLIGKPSTRSSKASLSPSKYRKRTYKFLEKSKVKVLEYGFIGRRRELQRGLQVLRGDQEQFGVLVTGAAGVGKSCLSGKWIERISHSSSKDAHGVSSKKLIVLHGELKWTTLLEKLFDLFDQFGIDSGIKILKSKEPKYTEPEDKLKALFREGEAFHELPVLIYCDDFEQNLIRRFPDSNEDQFVVDPERLPLVKSLIKALPWAEGKSNLLISSRYPFVLEEGEINLVEENLYGIPLMSLRGADLRKKRENLPNISNSEHRELYLECAGGNPRLLEWLEEIAKKEDQYDLEDLKKALLGKSEEYIGLYLAELLSGTEGEEFHHFLKQASVYRQPVPTSYFEDFGAIEHLQRGVRLTLFEEEEQGKGHSLFWVHPMIREGEWEKLNEKQQHSAQQIAYQNYDVQIETIQKQKKTPSLAWYEEALYHALESKQIPQACKHAIVLGAWMNTMLFYREQAAMQQRVADLVSPEVIEKAIQDKNEYAGILFNDLGMVYNTLGDHQQQIHWISKALQIAFEVYEKSHPNIAIYSNNLGMAWQSLGEFQKAIEYYEKALQITLKAHGEDHSQVATIKNNLGQAWHSLGEFEKAIEYYEKALEIGLKVYKQNHPQIALINNNFGEAWRSLGEFQRGIEYFKKALQITLKAYGQSHPQVAMIKNNLGMAWKSLGKIQRSIGYYEESLQINLKVYGQNNPSVARDYNNLGMARQSLGEFQKSGEYFEKALSIFILFLGEDHPDTKLVKKNLDWTRKKIEEAPT